MHFEHTSVFEKRYFLNTRAKNNREVSFLPGSVASPRVSKPVQIYFLNLERAFCSPRGGEGEERDVRDEEKETQRSSAHPFCFVSSSSRIFFFLFFFLQNFFCGGAGEGSVPCTKKAKIQSHRDL